MPTQLDISIHSPRMGRDAGRKALRAGRAISIHSPRMGRDARTRLRLRGRAGFQSTLPAWGETLLMQIIYQCGAFQSTLPAWGETPKQASKAAMMAFQSTLPAWGETPTPGPEVVTGSTRFQSTLPAWGETMHSVKPFPSIYISIHSPRMGRDQYMQDAREWASNFNPLSPHGERL